MTEQFDGPNATPVTAGAPDWFRAALGVPYEEHSVEVAGCPIHYLAWGAPGRQGLVFVHGGGAHARWWTHIAARFSSEFRVLAVDLSGHGDSGQRETYTLDQWTEEVMAVAADGGVAGKPVLIGHSMGGFVTIATAALNGDSVAGLIICDSPVTEPDPEVESYRLKQAFGRPRTYSSIDEAVGRFRTVPAQANSLSYVIDYVARNSLRPVEGGYRWKFDDNIFVQFARSMRGIALPYLHQVDCRVALLRSEFGLVTPTIGQSMFEALGRVAPVIELPEAGHHAVLGVPLPLLTALRTLLADGEHSDAHHAVR